MHHHNLEYRLKQRGRRSGPIVGVSILAAIALGVVSFILIYSLIDPLTTDFVSHSDAQSSSLPEFTPPAKTTPTPSESTITATTVAVSDPLAAATDAPKFTMLGNLDSTVEGSSFQPDYRVSASRRINLRSQPGTSSDVVAVLEVGAPLEYQNEQQVSDNPQRDELPQGGRWLKFRTEQGQEGWIREVDVAALGG